MRASKFTITILVLAMAVGASAGDLERSKVRRAPTAIQATDGPVTTTRDAQGVWFIEGGSLYDVYEAMGYAVATDRLWQMDIYRRAARGKLSELLGSDGLGLDVPMRIMGYSDVEYAAQFASLSADGQTVVQAFVDGVNRRIGDFYAGAWLQMPYEYWSLSLGSVLLGGGPPVLPAEWENADVLATMVLLARFFDGEGDWLNNDPAQLENFLLYGTLGAVYGAEGQAMFGDLRWVNDPSALTVVPSGGTKAAARPQPEFPAIEGVDLDALRDAIAGMNSQRGRIQQLLEDVGANVDLGSYAWSMSGEKTASGNPMLYSGPQMGFLAPAIIAEGSIRGGGLEVSGMHVPGIPAFFVARTPHHAWSLQTGHAHTVDFWLEAPETVSLHRMETINVFGAAPVTIPIFRGSHGPLFPPAPYNPADPPDLIFSWSFGAWGHEADSIDFALNAARAQSMDDFDTTVATAPVSFHMNYIDRDGNFAYWMSGWDRIYGPGHNPLFPSQTGLSPEWTGEYRPNVNDRNNPRGWYGGWNNKSAINYNNGTSAYNYYFGPAHRAHVIDEYLSTHDDLTFEQVRDLALNIATTDSFFDHHGGNTWSFVTDAFKAAVAADPNDDRNAAIAMLDAWDGHFVAGGPSEWRFGAFKADAWMLQNWWVQEVLRITFEDEFRTAGMSWEDQPESILYNVLLRALAGQTYYDWFQDKAGTGDKPTGAEAIIVRALDNVIEHAGLGPYNEPRGTIEHVHGVFDIVEIIGPLWTQTPYSSRSTYAQAVEYDMNGPIRIESMFPLGESGGLYYNGIYEPLSPFLTYPTPDDNFYSMVPFFDAFMTRPFPLFD
jgi:penicillin amidase